MRPMETKLAAEYREKSGVPQIACINCRHLGDAIRYTSRMVLQTRRGHRRYFGAVPPLAGRDVVGLAVVMSKHTSRPWRATGLPSGAVMLDQVYPMYRKAVLKAVIGIVGLDQLSVAAEACGMLSRVPCLSMCIGPPRRHT